MPEVSDLTADAAGESFARASLPASPALPLDLAAAALLSEIAPDPDADFSVIAKFRNHQDWAK